MYQYQYSMVPMNQQPPLPVVPPLLNPFVMQQLLQSQANAMSQFYGLPSYAGPADQGMAPTQQIQHQYYHRAPTSGPRRNQRGGFREAEPLHPNQFLYESSRTVADGRSTGIDPGNAWINSNDNPRVRKIRKSPYRRDNRPYRGPLTRDDVGPSGYVIPTADTKRGAMAGDKKIPSPTPSTSASISARPISTNYAEASSATGTTSSTSRNTNGQQTIEDLEDDFDTVSLGSESGTD